MGEHKSKGQFDIPGPSEATKGFECDKSGLTAEQLRPYDYVHCQPQPDITNCSHAAIPGASTEVTDGRVPCNLSRVNPGDTIEIHWPHTSGSTSFNGPFDAVASNALLVVQAQVQLTSNASETCTPTLRTMTLQKRPHGAPHTMRLANLMLCC